MSQNYVQLENSCLCFSIVQLFVLRHKLSFLMGHSYTFGVLFLLLMMFQHGDSSLDVLRTKCPSNSNKPEMRVEPRNTLHLHLALSSVQQYTVVLVDNSFDLVAGSNLAVLDTDFHIDCHTGRNQGLEVPTDLAAAIDCVDMDQHRIVELVVAVEDMKVVRLEED